MTEVRCSKCGREWDYGGQSEHYCTCPSCKTSVKIPEARLEEGESVSSAPGQVPESVVLQFGETEVEMGVEEAFQELADRVTSAGAAQEGLRQQLAERDEEIADLADQLHEQREATAEVAAAVKQLLEEMGGGVEWEHVGTEDDGEAASTVAEAAENVEVE